MKKYYMSVLVIVVLFCGTVYCVEGLVKKKVPMDKVNINDIMVKIKSANIKERMAGFDELVYPGDYKTKPDCKFKVSNSVSARKAVIDLLIREQKYESDNLTNGMYPPKLGEGFAYYIADIRRFVDSCEDESAIVLLPGSRTRNKYSQQTIEYILSRFEQHGADMHGLGYLGELAPRCKQTNKQLYERVKAKLIDSVDDEKVSRSAVYALEDLNDVDLIPVFEKISKYDDTKGTVRIYHGVKRVDPVSGIAKEALEKLQRKIKAKSPQLQPGATQGINVQ